MKYNLISICILHIYPLYVWHIYFHMSYIECKYVIWHINSIYCMIYLHIYLYDTFTHYLWHIYLLYDIFTLYIWCIYLLYDTLILYKWHIYHLHDTFTICHMSFLPSIPHVFSMEDPHTMFLPAVAWPWMLPDRSWNHTQLNIKKQGYIMSRRYSKRLLFCENTIFQKSKYCHTQMSPSVKQRARSPFPA